MPFDQAEYDRQRYQRMKADRNANTAPDPATQLQETDVAYIAGLLDGEGCLRIAYNKTHNRYTPELTISMTEGWVLVWLANVLKTKAFPERRRGKPAHHSDKLIVKLVGHRAIALAERCLPYFKVKHEQAKVFIEFRDTYIEQGGPGYVVPPGVMQRRAELKERIHQLNGGRNRTRVMPDHF